MDLLPLLMAAGARSPGPISRRLLGHDADPWVACGVELSTDTFEPLGELPEGATPGRVEQLAVERLHLREGYWLDCEVAQSPEDSLFRLFHDEVGRTLLSWEGDAFYGCERLLDPVAMSVAAELLETSLLAVMAPSRNALFVCSGEKLGEPRPLLTYSSRFFRQAKKPITPHVYFWDVEQGLVGAIRSRS